VVKENEINKENVNKMVKMFYAKVIKDDEIGYFFTEILGDNLQNEQWQKHIEILTNFWLSMTGHGQDYKGNPFMPHMALKGLNKDKFSRWIEMFHKIVSKVYSEEVAKIFKNKGSMVATNFMRNLEI
jgi:hemoglobin